MDTTFLGLSADGGAPYRPLSGAALRNGTRGELISGENTPPPPPLPPRGGRPRKRTLGPKNPPQRGLGVAKLERLRLQEQWRKMVEAPYPSPALVDGQPYQRPLPPGSATIAPLPGSPVGLPFAGLATGPAPEGCGGSGGGGERLGDSWLPDSLSVDRYGAVTAAEISMQVGNGAFTEFPSSQRWRCSEMCVLCIGVRSEGRRGRAASVDRERSIAPPEEEEEVKEHAFFPGTGVRGSNPRDERRASDDQTADDRRTLGGRRLDLSLKLSSFSS